MKTDDLNSYFAMKETEEQKILNRQMDRGLRMIAKWEFIFREESPELFENMLNAKLPYWKKHIQKYKWVAPSIPRILQEKWESYKILKRRGETEDLSSLF